MTYRTTAHRPALRQRSQGGIKIVRRGCFKSRAFAGGGMSELNDSRMQHLARRVVTAQFGEACTLSLAVGFVAKNGMPEVLEMNANLVRAPRVKFRLHMRCPLQTQQDTVARPGLASALHRSHPLPVRGMPGDSNMNLAFIPSEHAANNCFIKLPHITPGELLRESHMRCVILRHDEASARVLVQPMNDSRPLHAPDATKTTAAMVEQGVDNRARLISCCRVNDNTWRFIQHQQVVVLMQHIERNLLWLRLGWLRLRKMNCDNFAATRRVRGLYCVSVDCDVPLLDEPLNGPTGNGGETLAEE